MYLLGDSSDFLENPSRLLYKRSEIAGSNFYQPSKFYIITLHGTKMDIVM